MPELSDLTFTYELALKVEVCVGNYLYMQGSMLYTSSDGVRLIRITNHRLLLTDKVQDLLESINCDVFLNFGIKQSVKYMIEKNILIYGRKYFEYRCSELISSCYKNLQKIPQNLANLIIKTLGLLKHPLFLQQNLPCKSN